MRVGYARVSSADQNLARQLDSLRDAKVEKIYEEKQSGKDTSRPVLKEVLSFVREGDTLIIHSFDRLARSTIDLLNITEELRKKGVGLVSLKESIDTTGASGKLILTIFAGLAEFERATIRERQREGIASAKKRGQHLGRPKVLKPSNWEQVVTKWKAKEITATAARKELKLTKATFYRLLKKLDDEVAR